MCDSSCPIVNKDALVSCATLKLKQSFNLFEPNDTFNECNQPFQPAIPGGGSPTNYVDMAVNYLQYAPFDADFIGDNNLVVGYNNSTTYQATFPDFIPATTVTYGEAYTQSAQAADLYPAFVVYNVTNGLLTESFRGPLLGYDEAFGGTIQSVCPSRPLIAAIINYDQPYLPDLELQNKTRAVIYSLNNSDPSVPLETPNALSYLDGRDFGQSEADFQNGGNFSLSAFSQPDGKYALYYYGTEISYITDVDTGVAFAFATVLKFGVARLIETNGSVEVELVGEPVDFATSPTTTVDFIPTPVALPPYLQVPYPLYPGNQTLFKRDKCNKNVYYIVTSSSVSDPTTVNTFSPSTEAYLVAYKFDAATKELTFLGLEPIPQTAIGLDLNDDTDRVVVVSRSVAAGGLSVLESPPNPITQTKKPYDELRIYCLNKKSKNGKPFTLSSSVDTDQRGSRAVWSHSGDLLAAIWRPYGALSLPGLLYGKKVNGECVCTDVDGKVVSCDSDAALILGSDTQLYPNPAGTLQTYSYNKSSGCLAIQDVKFTAPSPFALAWNRCDDKIFVGGEPNFVMHADQLYSVSQTKCNGNNDCNA